MNQMNHCNQKRPVIKLKSKEDIVSILEPEVHLDLIQRDQASMQSAYLVELRLELIRQLAHHFKEKDTIIDISLKASIKLMEIIARYKLDEEWSITEKENEDIISAFVLFERMLKEVGLKDIQSATAQAEKITKNKTVFGFI